MAIIELSEVKAFLKMDAGDLSNDPFIEAMIPEIEGVIEKYCDDDFKNDDGEDNYPPGLKLIASKMIGSDLQQLDADGIKSYKLGDYSETRADVGQYPQSIYTALDKFKKREIKFL